MARTCRPPWPRSPARALVAVLLPAFFALSGFLVAGSLERTKTVGMFLGLRALRDLPGARGGIADRRPDPWAALLTTRPLADYVADPQFRTYFLNIAGDPQFSLPGVFQTNPFYEVNGQLWTIPSELRCYVILTVLALLGAVRRPAILLAATGGLLAWDQWSTRGCALRTFSRRSAGRFRRRCCS